MSLIQDKEIAWKRHQLWFPVNQWQNGSISSNLHYSQLGTTIMHALHYTNRDIVRWGMFRIPKWFNPQFELGVTVHWSSTTTTSARTIHPRFKYVFMSIGDAFPGHDVAIGSSQFSDANALDTILVEQAYGSGTPYRWLKTNRGIVNKNWLTNDQIHEERYMIFGLAFPAALSNTILSNGQLVYILGIDFDYVPMMTRKPHSEIDAPVDDAY